MIVRNAKLAPRPAVALSAVAVTLGTRVGAAQARTPRTVRSAAQRLRCACCVAPETWGDDDRLKCGPD
eukprot:7379328-Prymnesium_polylepis.3